ncbi:MAG: C2 family cysteine protease [Oculatellaceae cyanobacterium bins.114]|nr:C2 family cysteine protease [Oculatellaceae cyanobacterium bins.114]
MAVDLAGNSIGQASSLNLTSNSATFRDQLSSQDKNDYLRFSLGSRSSIFVSLSGLRADANLQLLSASGEVLKTSARPRNNAEQVLAILNAGTYYLRAYTTARKANTSYTLRATTTPLTLPQTIPSYQRYTFKYSYGNGDYYTGYGYAANGTYASGQWLYDNAPNETGNYGFYQITSLDTLSNSSGIDTVNTVWVTNYYNSEDSTHYTPSNSTGTNGLGSESGYLISSDASSYFRGRANEADITSIAIPQITVSSPTANHRLNPGASYSISWTDNLSENVKIDLYKGNAYFSTIAPLVASTGNYVWTLPTNIISGADFQIRISSVNTNTIFDDSDGYFSIVPIDNAGDSLATARVISPSTTVAQLSDWVGALDINDYYAFNISNTSNFSLALNGLTADANVQLLNSSGVALQSSMNAGTTSESITRQLTSGTYYLRVSPGSGADANYTLAVSATPASTATIDLSGTFLDAPTTLTAGNNVPVSFRVQNSGNTNTGSFWVGFYVSRDAVITNGDRLLGSYQINNLAAGATTATLTSTAATLPIATDPFWSGNGTYYIGMLVDSTGAIVETNETNNWNRGTGIDLDSVAITVGDWFDLNIQDVGLRTAARTRFNDQIFDRSDMIAILQDVKDGSVIDTTEFGDLQTLVANVTYIAMPEYVRVLSKKVVNGNTANQWYQGNLLGNLYAGSSATQLQTLIDKWFFGLDRPTAPTGFTMSYQLASGNLFGNDGVFAYQDINQGYLGDCYFLASLAANAAERPSIIRNMFIDNGDGTFTVRFYGQHDGQVTTAADYVTVDRYLPTNVSSNGYTGQRFAEYDSANIGLWVALAEKAYAQFAEQNLIDQDSAVNSYGSIVGGNGFRAMPSISGISGGLYSDINYVGRVGTFPTASTMSNLLAAGTPLLAGSISNPNLGIYGNHQYMIVSVNTLSQSLLLYNPHGQTWFPPAGEDTNGFRTISYVDFKANFDTVEYA